MLLATGCILLLLAGFMVWARPFSFKPGPEALDSIAKSQSVQKIDLGWGGTSYAFLPDRTKAGQGKGLILYPGGLIDARAYAPLMQAIAAEGYLAIAVAMPLDLAVLGYKRAAAVVKQFPEIEKWVLGGHSLGGVMACRYARSNAAQISGLILLASYPSRRFRVDAMTLQAASVFASRDGLTTLSDIEASKQHLPEGTQFFEIQGGNHSQFCCLKKKNQRYPGDNPAAISRAQQQQETMRAAVAVLKRL
ncbi:MAG: alpha/beta hydrolase [Deltaproteobacteria bacterium]|nr:alpha/beta hydrolase [Deltaproteobacteria bacterium]